MYLGDQRAYQQHSVPEQHQSYKASKMDGFGSLAQGELAPHGEGFVAFALVKKYADLFIGKMNGPKVMIHPRMRTEDSG